MRIRIQSNNVSRLGGQQWESFFQVNSPYCRVGIFWYASDHYQGGWIKFPFRFQFEFEALSHTVRQIGQMRLLEITVETEEQLRQIANQIVEHLDHWKLAEKISSDPLIYGLIEEFIDTLPNFIDELTLLKNQLVTEMSWDDAIDFNWKEINEEISRCRSMFSVNDLPEKFQKTYKDLQQDLYAFEREFQLPDMYKVVLKRELIAYSSSYETFLNQYKTEKLTLESISVLLNEVQELQTEFKDFWDRIYQNNETRRLAEAHNTEKSQLVNNINQLSTKIQNEFQEFERVIQLERKREAIEQSVLQQLKELTPDIQTLLTRISELTDIEKEFVEAAIIRLVEKFPDLGSYDKVSQVFILGKSMPNKIDSMLESYPEASFEDTIALLDQGEELSQYETYFLVPKLYKEIETKIRSLVQSDDKIDFLNAIDLAYGKEVINHSEQSSLHQFRKIRNELIHGTRESFPSDLILTTYRIFKRLSS